MSHAEIAQWRGKRVLVTGAGGFIGSHLTERLVQLGADVRAMVHYNAMGTRGWLDDSTVAEEVEIVAGDIVDRDSVRQAMNGMEVVFHLAALIAIPYSYRAPSSYLRTNVEGTLNVLQAARDFGIERLVHTSTSEVYGTAQYVPIDESHPLQAQSPYAASKIGADKMAEAFHRSFGVPVATIRPFNTFGPRQSARAVIPTIVIQALTQSEIRLGNLSPTRDFNYVENTVSGFIRVAEHPAAIGQVTNIGSGQEISIGDLASEISDLVGRAVSVVSEDKRLRPENSEVDRLLASNEKAAAALGWTPQRSLKDGLKKTIAWLEENIVSYRPDVYSV